MSNKILFTPNKINNLEIRNRIIMSAMHLGYSEDKEVSKKGIEFYKARAKGGAGAIVIVAAINEMAGPPNMHFVSEDKYIKGFNALAEAVHEHGTKLFVQLFHCGRNGISFILGGKDPLAPSAVPSPIYKEVPKEMTIEDIKSTIKDFGDAAVRCKEAGVDGVEISCSAGYLLTQFLSPLTNLRTDEYGGSKENRMRFPKEVIKEVRERVGQDYPVLLRISGSDMMPGGYGIDFMQEFCGSLEPGLIDAINVTGGWHESPVPQITSHVPEGGYAYLAEAIKRVVDIPVIASNRINNGEIAEKILEKGMADFVGVARGFLTDAEFANKVRDGKKYRRCVACNKGCIENVLKGMDARCAYNPEIGHEGTSIEKSEVKKKVLIIGAGPAGMQAAKSAALKGHDVILCTKDHSIGGTLFVASKPPHKQGIAEFVETMKEELKELNIDIRFNTSVGSEFIKKIDPNYVILATGSTPSIPKIEGIGEANVYTAEAVLKGDRDILEKVRRGKTFIIGGGSVGLETAHYIAEQAFVNNDSMNFINSYINKDLKKNVVKPIDITIVEMEKKVGKDLGGSKWILLNELKEFGIKIMADTKVLSLGGNSISVSNNEGEQVLPADNIILATGYTSTGGELVKYLEENNIPYSLVGDALKPRNIMESITQGYKAASKI